MALVVAAQWRPILRGPNNQVVLYNPDSKALSVLESAQAPLWAGHAANPIDEDDVEEEINNNACHFCGRPYSDFNEDATRPHPSRAPNYFHLLAAHNEIQSRPTSRSSSPPRNGRDGRTRRSSFTPDAMAQGYFQAFFHEERKLGTGANGTVYLCQHVLEGNLLGRFAVKKIAVGRSSEYLTKILKEVRVLETLRHENIVTYHHSWLEDCQFSPFAPKIPTLFVLMQWADGGSLDDFIAIRSGGREDDSTTDGSVHSKSARIAAFRNRSTEGDRRKRNSTKMLHYLNLREIMSLLEDIAAGLKFLHDRAIMHLDLKPGNVLLSWEGDRLIPRAMLCDFGASRDMINQNSNARSGVTGTLEYTAPETLARDPSTGKFRPTDSKADMWSLGVILHKLIFLQTPYQDVHDLEILQEQVVNYRGFILEPEVQALCSTRGIPVDLLHLLGSLLDRRPATRPTCEQVLAYVREKKRLVDTSASSSGPKAPGRRSSGSDANKALAVQSSPVFSRPLAIDNSPPPSSAISDVPPLVLDQQPSEEESETSLRPQTIVGLPRALPWSEYKSTGLSLESSRWSLYQTHSRTIGKACKSILLFVKIVHIAVLCGVSARPANLTLEISKSLSMMSKLSPLVLTIVSVLACVDVLIPELSSTVSFAFFCAHFMVVSQSSRFDVIR